MGKISKRLKELSEKKSTEEIVSHGNQFLGTVDLGCGIGFSKEYAEAIIKFNEYIEREYKK